MSADEVHEAVLAFAADLKAWGCEYQLEVHVNASEGTRLRSAAYAPRPFLSDGNELADVPLDDLLDEIRERVEGAGA